MLDTNGGSVTFNEDNNVLPPEVVNLNTDPIDGLGVQAFSIGGRRVVMEEDGDPANLVATYLTTVGTIIMRPDGKLVWATFRDYEDTQVSAYQSDYSFNTGHMNTIISHVHAGQFVPNYDSVTSSLHSNASSGVQPVQLDFSLSGHTQGSLTPKNFKYRMTVNANDERQIGGFAFSLNSLRVYLNPMV